MKRASARPITNHCTQMCFDDEFRLCSCDAEALSEEEIGWILRVRDGALEPCREGQARRAAAALGGRRHEQGPRAARAERAQRLRL